MKSFQQEIITIVKVCGTCTNSYPVSYPKEDIFKRRAAESRKNCDACDLNKALGKKISKYDW